MRRQEIQNRIPNRRGGWGRAEGEPPARLGNSKFAGGSLRSTPASPNPGDCGELNYRLRRTSHIAGARHMKRSEDGSGTSDVTVPRPTP